MSRATVFIPRARLVPSGCGKDDVIKAAATLARLAQHVLDSDSEIPERTIAAVVRTCCPGIPSGERMRLWGEYLDAVKQESDLLDGVITWQAVDPEINTLDRTQTAIDVAVEMSRQALEALVGGAS